jgi:quercetin dioxygenase-like cupin family protein
MRKVWLLSLSLSLSLAFCLSLSLASSALANNSTASSSTASSSGADQGAKVTPLMAKDLVGVAGKEISMITVEYTPGSVDPIHTHNAQAMVYVLEGEIVMQVKGGPQVTLKPGETFYEGPEDVHIVGRNASKTKPAKFVVFFVKEKGAPILTPVQ